MLELALELAGGTATVAGVARVALARRRPPARDVARDIAALERWHEIESTARYAGYDPDLCIAAADRGEPLIATCERRPPSHARSNRELEHQLFFGPGAVWPVEDANFVQIIPAFSATSCIGTTLAAHGLINSGFRAELVKRQWMDDVDQRQLSLDDEPLH